MAKFTDVISGLTESTDPQGDSDYIVGYDGSAVVKILIDNLGAAISLDAIGAPSDSTSLNASTDAHGLLPKLDGNTSNFLNGAGAWAEPAGSGGTSYDYIILQDQKSKGTQGGTFTQDAWQTRTLNTEVVDSSSDCTLSSNQFTLAAGTYLLIAQAPAFRVNANQIRLANISDTDYDYGSIGYTTSSANNNTSTSFLYTYFTIADSKTFEIQHYCQSTYADLGFGPELNQGTEVYTQVYILKVA